MKSKNVEKVFEIFVFFILSDGEKKEYAKGSKSYKLFDDLFEDVYILEHLKEFDGLPILNREIKIHIID